MLTFGFFLVLASTNLVPVWVALATGLPATLAAIFAFANGRRQKEYDYEGLKESFDAVLQNKTEIIAQLAEIQKELKFNGGGSLKDMVKSVKGNQEYLACEVANLKMMADHIIKDSLGKLRIMFASSSVGYYETDERGDCTYVNAAWTGITGLSFEEAKGGGWMHAVLPTDLSEIQREWSSAIDEQRQFGPIDYNFFKDGRAILVRGTANPIFNAEQKISGWVGTITPK